ncbi:PA14 domain-containing protein [Hymenobacter wooponensis]|uniref:PA14 domain-containing protein n=1 Tax=Hymenobacter wooponensis TaxID=1525360 RepID=UPI00143688A9|nr:PA14 domain-containing protein [Hymenobacter wooponensis]
MQKLLFCSILGLRFFDWSSAASAQGLGTGLTALYYNNGTLAGAPVLKRLDPNVEFHWGMAAPAPEVSKDNFSVRWEGLLAAPATGTYKFAVATKEGVRLWVNGKKVLDTWNGKGSVQLDGNTVSLAAGEKTTIKLEYFDEDGDATVALQWMPPGQALQTIPAGDLYPVGSPTTPDPAEAVQAALAAKAAAAQAAHPVAAKAAPAANAPALTQSLAPKAAPAKKEAPKTTTAAKPAAKPAPKATAAKPSTAAPVAPAAAAPTAKAIAPGALAGGVFMLKSKADGTALEVADESHPYRGAPTVPGRSTPPQWKIENAGDGYYRLLVQGSTKVLEVLGSSTSNGAPMSLWSFYSGNNQLWQIEEVGDGYYKLIAKHSRKALTAKDSLGGGIQQWRYKGEPTQQWKIEPAVVEVPKTTLAASKIPGIGANNMSVYPNPSNGVVQMNYTLAETMPLGWVLYDQRGIVVRVSDYRKQAPGQHNQSLDFTSLPAGDYNLHLTVGTVTTSQPLQIRRPKAEPTGGQTAAQ